MKKSNSITVIGNRVKCAYVIKDINVDEVTMEKYGVECREDIENAWGMTSPSSGQSKFPDHDDKVFEVILLEKINNITLAAKPNVIETVAKLGGKIIKDFKVEKPKRGQRAHLTDIVFFNEPAEE